MKIRIDFTSCTVYSHIDIRAFAPYILVPIVSEPLKMCICPRLVSKYGICLTPTVLRPCCVALQFIDCGGRDDNASTCHCGLHTVKYRHETAYYVQLRSTLKVQAVLPETLGHVNYTACIRIPQ
jgi:hypothetical protein